MFRRLFFPVLMTVLGCAVLVSLGAWQMQRLEWKSAILAEIDARVADAPSGLPAIPDAGTQKYQPVEVTGKLIREPLYVLTTVKDLGAGYRYIAPFLAEERVMMVDLGFAPLEARRQPPLTGELTVIGNLHWPDEIDGWTPEPDGNLWYARDTERMAVALSTEAMLIVAREIVPVDPQAAPPATVPLPVTSAGVPNNHLNYAITWFLLALVWAGMGAYLIARVLRRKEG